MSSRLDVSPLSFRAPLEDYERQAEGLLRALREGDDAARWRFKWEHDRFRGRHVSEVRAAELELADAQLVVAHSYAFDGWAGLAAFVVAVQRDGPDALFESAVDAVVSGELATLRTIVRAHPSIVRARSMRRHHATLLHYLGANGVEGGRQRTPPNAVEVATLLLEGGAEVDALADMYDSKCTTMSMLVSSSHPDEAGLQADLAETLLDYGAAFVGPGSSWQSALMTALTFGYPKTATRLAARGAPVDRCAAAAGLGLIEETARLLPGADANERRAALALASQLGQAEIVRLLLDAGEDPSRYNPEGYHSHATPLHQAVWAGHGDVVRVLVERGARLDLKDTIYDGTPVDWATYGGKTAIAEYLRGAA